MDRNDDDRSIRRIALRILNEDEDQSREELDGVIQAVEDQIERRSSFYTWSVPLILTFPALGLVVAMFATLVSGTAANAFLAMTIVACLIPLVMAWLWHRFQYGSGRLRKPREAIYADAGKETRETLEKLFAYLQRESAPRAYYRNWRGNKRYLERRYSFGSLRVLLLSEFASVRALCLSPSGSRISGAIKLDGDPDEVVKKLDIKPKRKGGKGTKRTYPYDDAAIAMFGDPRADELDLSDQEKATLALRRWMLDWLKANPDESARVPDIDAGPLITNANKIFEQLKKKAALKQRRH
jgi:hypothetical protein